MEKDNGELYINDDGDLLLAMENGKVYLLENIPDEVGNKVKVSLYNPEALH